MQPKSRVFIGSSVEGLSIAEHIQLSLDYHAECTLWSQGVFGLSGGTLESLLKAAKEFDFAVLVLTPDDLVQKRSVSRNSPRDNVLFELGLFMGALGRERTYIVYCRDTSIDLPTDLAGVASATFAKRADGNLQAAIGPVCTQLKTAMATVRPAHQDNTTTSSADITSKLAIELSLLKADFSMQMNGVHRLLESIMSDDKKLIPTQAVLRSFEGAWKDSPTGSMHYVRYCDDGTMRCVYCYGGNDRVTGEYYDWKLINKTMICRFRWLDDANISGYAYLRTETANRLVGGWWSSEDMSADLIEKIPKMGGGIAMTWLRQPVSFVAPAWVENAFQQLQREQKK